MTFSMRRRRFLSYAAAIGVAGCQSGPVPLREVAPQLPPELPLSRIAFSSCADESKPQPIWDAVIADKPDLMLFGGDNVYSSEQPWSAQKLRSAYAMAAAIPGFARLRQSIPHLATWDDHDYGLNDGGADFAHKQESKAIFLDFWEVGATDARRAREGIHHAEMFGPPGQRVQVILLDTRWFRSPWKITDQRNAPGKERFVPDPDPAKTLLGPTQWKWLEAQLREAADVRLVLSSCQVVADGHGWERWGNFPMELQKLFDLIARTKANGVVFLSGDRHIGAMYRETRGAPYPMFEITSSGITHPWAQANEAGPNRIVDLFTEQHFGTVDIDWRARIVKLALKDGRGAARRSHSIAIDDLKVKA